MPSQSSTAERARGETVSTAPSSAAARRARATRRRRPRRRLRTRRGDARRAQGRAWAGTRAGRRARRGGGRDRSRSSSPSCSRTRASARESRDLTVPTRRPSAAAVSSSLRPRKCRHETTSRSSSPSAATARSRRSRSSAASSSCLGRRGRAARGVFVRDPEREVLAPAGGAAAVPRLVDDDLEQPRPERRAAAKAAERREGLHERVLRRLLGVRGRARDEVRGPECDLLMQHDESLVGRGVATLRLLDELRLCEWSAHHLIGLHRGEPQGSPDGAMPLMRLRLDACGCPCGNSSVGAAATRVAIYDTTLRDGTQAEGISLSVDDKLAIAHRLDELGFDYVEGGWPGSNPKDEQFFAAMAEQPLRARPPDGVRQHAPPRRPGRGRRPAAAAARRRHADRRARGQELGLPRARGAADDRSRRTWR